MKEKTEEKTKQKSPVQILISKVDNLRNEISMLRHRVEEVEKATVSIKDYVKDQLVELYSQIEAARETMDEITEFFEDMNKEEEDEDEHERDFIIEQELEQTDLLGEDGYPEDEQEVTELELHYDDFETSEYAPSVDESNEKEIW